MMIKKIRVSILDDHQITLYGYLHCLGQVPSIEVVNTLHFGEELEPALEQKPTDVLILDVSVPTAPDNRAPYPILHIIPQLLNRYPDLEILVISMFTDRSLIRALVDAGASGYIFKDDQQAIQGLDKVVTVLANGGNYFSPEARELILKNRGQNSIEPLTARQLEALSLYAADPASPTLEIAKKMVVSVATLRNHFAQAALRLGVHSRSAAVARARDLGLITPNQPASPVQLTPLQQPEKGHEPGQSSSPIEHP